jgi:hypothetical protein
VHIFDGVVLRNLGIGKVGAERSRSVTNGKPLNRVCPGTWFAFANSRLRGNLKDKKNINSINYHIL